MRALLSLFILLWSTSVFGQSHSEITLDVSKAQLISQSTQIAKGDQVSLAFTIKPKDGWHSYWVNPGDSGAAPIFKWSKPDAIKIAEPKFQAPIKINTSGIVTYGFKGQSTIMFDVTIPADYSDNQLDISLDAEWLICEEECIPQFGTFNLSLPVTDSRVENKEHTSVFDDFSANAVEPSWWNSKISYNQVSATLQLYMDPSEMTDIVSAQYFPYTMDVLNYSAEQTIAKMDDGLYISFEHSNEQLPEKAAGVLSLTNKDGETSHYELIPTIESTVPTAGKSTDQIAVAPVTFPIWQALIFAFFGGLLLNLMPCVFPVLSLKAFAFVSTGGMTRRERLIEGWAYTAGILASFAVIVLALIILRSGGQALGWGFQLQSPGFVGFMVVMLVLVAMSLGGIFNFQTGFEGAGQGLAQKSGPQGAFFTGVLATLVATPCTVPLMAPAIGFALTQSDPILFMTLMSLGFGLASPFLLLAYSDWLASKMPRPGAWMDTVKQALAFPMILTAFWLTSVYAEQTGGFLTLLALVTVVAFFVWLREKLSSRLLQIIALGLVLAITAYITFGPKETVQTTAQSAASASASGAFTPEKVQKLQAEGKPVFVYFTADWCITCKVNEKLALKRDETQEMFKKHGITLLKSDETAKFSDATLKILKKHGRAGIPLYLYYPSDGSGERLLPSVITVDILKEWIEGKGV